MARSTGEEHWLNFIEAGGGVDGGGLEALEKWLREPGNLPAHIAEARRVLRQERERLVARKQDQADRVRAGEERAALRYREDELAAREHALRAREIEFGERTADAAESQADSARETMKASRVSVGLSLVAVVIALAALMAQFMGKA